jgi:isoleucyl-tRNA synthetase
VRLIAPLLAFTADEVWSHTAKPVSAPSSVHLALLPEPAEVASGLPAERLAEWDRLMEVRDAVLKALEEARQAKLIGTSLEARVRLQGYEGGFETELPSVFIVSQVLLEPGENLRVIIERADGIKCERCWKYSTAVGQDLEFLTVCDSCSAALRDMQ